MTFDSVLARARSEGRSLLNEVEAKEILAEAGIPATATTLATTAAEARPQADGMGYPVVLKVVSPDIAHKSDVGGVNLNLAGRRRGRCRLRRHHCEGEGRRARRRIDGVSVQQMAPQGTEVIVGMTTDTSSARS